MLISGLYWHKSSIMEAILSFALAACLHLIGLEPIRKYLLINQAITPEQIGLLSIAITISMMIYGSIAFPDKDVKTMDNKNEY